MKPSGAPPNLDEGASCSLMLALRSLRTGAGSKVGRPVADVVVVQVDETRLSKPGGKLLLRRWEEGALILLPSIFSITNFYIMKQNGFLIGSEFIKLHWLNIIYLKFGHSEIQ